MKNCEVAKLRSCDIATSQYCVEAKFLLAVRSFNFISTTTIQ
jgi:hypothetical protein